MKQKSKTQKNKLPKRNRPFFSFVKRILRLFYKKPKIVYFGEQIKEPSIIVSNHEALKGPVIHELYLPVFNAKWGAGEMLGNYKMRYKYLRNVFYMQKMGYGKVKATLLAVFSAFFSKFFYKGMNVLPTWRDWRMFTTIKHSIDILKDGTSILIFPEDSDEGYKDVMKKFHAGFVALAEGYYIKTKKDIPVYPVYYHRKKRVLAVGKAMYVQDQIRQGLGRAEIADEYRKVVNDLYSRI